MNPRVRPPQGFAPRQHRAGAALGMLVMVSATLISLLVLTIDSGLLILRREQLVSSLEAAVLAGADELAMVDPVTQSEPELADEVDAAVREEVERYLGWNPVAGVAPRLVPGAAGCIVGRLDPDDDPLADNRELSTTPGTRWNAVEISSKLSDTFPGGPVQWLKRGSGNDPSGLPIRTRAVVLRRVAALRPFGVTPVPWLPLGLVERVVDPRRSPTDSTRGTVVPHQGEFLADLAWPQRSPTKSQSDQTVGTRPMTATVVLVGQDTTPRAFTRQFTGGLLPVDFDGPEGAVHLSDRGATADNWSLEDWRTAVESLEYPPSEHRIVPAGVLRTVAGRAIFEVRDFIPVQVTGIECKPGRCRFHLIRTPLSTPTAVIDRAASENAWLGKVVLVR